MGGADQPARRQRPDRGHGAGRSGPRRRQGAITRTGSDHVRRVLVEAAWSCRFPARKTALLRRKAASAAPRALRSHPAPQALRARRNAMSPRPWPGSWRASSGPPLARCPVDPTPGGPRAEGEVAGTGGPGLPEGVIFSRGRPQTRFSGGVFRRRRRQGGCRPELPASGGRERRQHPRNRRKSGWPRMSPTGIRIGGLRSKDRGAARQPVATRLPRPSTKPRLACASPTQSTGHACDLEIKPFVLIFARVQIRIRGRSRWSALEWS